MVHEKVTKLSQEVSEKESKLKLTVSEIVNLDSIRLEKIIQTAMSGLSFDKIWETRKTVIAGEDEISKTVYTYLEKNGKKLRGLKVAEYKGDKYSKDTIAEREDKYELWLTPNSFIKTHVFGETVHEVWGRSDLRRDVVNYDYDPLTLNTFLEYEYDIDIIIDAICNHLSDRSSDLEYRIVKQEERLAKIKELHIL